MSTSHMNELCVTSVSKSAVLWLKFGLILRPVVRCRTFLTINVTVGDLCKTGSLLGIREEGNPWGTD